MNRFNFLALAVAIIACSSAVCAYSSQSGYSNSGDGASGDYQLQGANADNNGASAGASAQSSDNVNSYSQAGPSSYGSNRNIPYAPQNTKGNTVTSSITYPQNKGEILIHRPAAIIVKRPPTKVLVNHPPLVVKPAPVVLHKPPAIVMRKVYVKHHPRPVKVEPVYVNVVKPPAEKYFVNEKQQQYGGQNLAPVNYGSGANGGSASGLSGLPAIAAANTDTAAHSAGYQLLQGNLANIHGAISADHYGAAGSHQAVYAQQPSYAAPASYSHQGSYAAPASYAAQPASYAAQPGHYASQQSY